LRKRHFGLQARPFPTREPKHGRLLFLLAGVAALITIAVTVGAVRSETLDGGRIIVIDGDTVALPCATPAPGCAEKIRLTAIDAPETFHPGCEAELKAGLRAKERLAQLLRAGPVEVVRSGRKDRYGRTLADLRTAAGDVGGILLEEGLALPYRPGWQAKNARETHWCGG
jgi:endonuclease YncB( thermonuclease family)